MSSQYFGFEDEEIVEVIDTIAKTSSAVRTPIEARVGSNEMSISDIQALLGKDSTIEESALDSTVTAIESSFYGDDDTSICQSQLDSNAEESFSVDGSTLSNITIVNGKLRRIIKAGRRTRKVLGSLDDNSESSSTASTPVRNNKKRVPRSATKNKENQPPKRVKTAKENTPDENDDELANQLNKRFKEIENFKLVVE